MCVITQHSRDHSHSHSPDWFLPQSHAPQSAAPKWVFRTADCHTECRSLCHCPHSAWGMASDTWWWNEQTESVLGVHGYFSSFLASWCTSYWSHDVGQPHCESTSGHMTLVSLIVSQLLITWHWSASLWVHYWSHDICKPHCGINGSRSWTCGRFI